MLINKNKVGIPETKDIRPITIQSPIQKLYELTVAPELKRLNARTSPNQFGFKPASSTAHVILGLYSFVTNLPPRSRRCQGVLLIDFKKAYDAVDHMLLYQTLTSAGTNREDLTKVRAIHANSKVLINGIGTILTRGLPQGSVLSPHLFQNIH